MNEITHDTRLSYSSATLLVNCEQRYYNYKISKLPPDEDFEENYEAFNVGKAFHYVLEHNKHTAERLAELIPDACKRYEVDHLKPMIHAMVLKYLEKHFKSGLKVVQCELQVADEVFLGFIDAIMIDNDGGWWIVDLKTAGRDDPFLIPKLLYDPQLNLYSGYAPKIAEILKLDPEKFKGSRYRVTTKKVLKRKRTEGYKEYVGRLLEGTFSHDVVIPRTMMKPQELGVWHERLHERAMELRQGYHTATKPMRNYSYCFSFFRPCPYYSKCHGMTVEKAMEALECL